MLIAVLIVVLNVVNTTGEYLLSSKAQQEARSALRDRRGVAG